MANPTVDEVLAILVDEMKLGSSLEIAENALTMLDERFRTKIATQLTIDGSWDRDGEVVRNAARQVGTIAAALASVMRKTTVTRDHVRKASSLVQVECATGFGEEGSWCQP